MHPRAETARITGLDGLRGLAVVLVVLAHANVPFIRFGGIAGVALFFVLSGYLVTSLLVEEVARHDNISLRSFYARRVLRLLPALAVALVAGGVAAALLDRQPGAIGAAFVVALLQLGNLPATFEIDPGPFAHLWTLSLEWQFYLIWPLALIVTRTWRRSALIGLVIVIAAASLVSRFSYDVDNRSDFWTATYSPQTNVYALLLGSAAALILARRTSPPALPNWAWRLSLAMMLIVATVPGLKDGLRESATTSSLISRLVAAPLCAIAGLGLVLCVVTGSTSLPTWIASPPMLFFGKISYGLYLWHEIIDWLLGVGLGIGTRGVPGLVAGTVSALVATGVAVLSKRHIEDPFLGRKQRLERSRAH